MEEVGSGVDAVMVRLELQRIQAVLRPASVGRAERGARSSRSMSAISYR